MSWTQLQLPALAHRWDGQVRKVAHNEHLAVEDPCTGRTYGELPVASAEIGRASCRERVSPRV